MEFINSILYPGINPYLAKVRLRAIVVFILLTDSTINTFVLISLSLKPSNSASSDHDAIKAFSITRSVCLFLFSIVWLVLRIRLRLVDERGLPSVRVVRKAIFRSLSATSQHIWNFCTNWRHHVRLRKKEHRQVQNLDLATTAYHPTSTSDTHHGSQAQLVYEENSPPDRAKNPNYNRIPSISPHFPRAPSHASDNDGRSSRRGFKNRSEAFSPNKYQQGMNNYPFETIRVSRSLDPGTGHSPEVPQYETSENPFEHHSDGLRSKERAQYKPGANHNVQLSSTDTQRHKSARASIVEQAPRNPPSPIADMRTRIHNPRQKSYIQIPDESTD